MIGLLVFKFISLRFVRLKLKTKENIKKSSKNTTFRKQFNNDEIVLTNYLIFDTVHNFDEYVGLSAYIARLIGGLNLQFKIETHFNQFSIALFMFKMKELLKCYKFWVLSCNRCADKCSLVLNQSQTCFLPLHSECYI
jgi:hypothetical protein